MSTLAKDGGLAVNRGIVVDASMRTSDPDILALGECAEVGGMVYGLVAPLYEMARIAAAQLAGDETAAFVHSDTPTKLKVTGINLFSLGDFAEGDDREEIVLRDATAGVYKRLVLKDNRIIGTVLYGETADGAWFNDLKKKRHRHLGDARHADLRPGLPGRVPAGPYGGRCSLAG